ncbi:DEAD/DEAH box helicase [Parapedobacter pyrenivorans]|uniref:DEAD/DEAH box helicase n=1 Tax=Parapedobacter pyrenivorans TaxID=1305674 RepID=UPI003341901D
MSEQSSVKKQKGATEKLRSSNYFLIPWEDGEEFKLTAEYLIHFVSSNVVKLEDCRYSTSVQGLRGDLLTIRAYKKGIDYTITVRISLEGLALVGGCHGNSKKLCKEAYFTIKSFLQASYSDFRFKEFYYPEMLALGESSYKFFHFGNQWWGSDYQMLPHPEYGFIYGMKESNKEILRSIGFSALDDRSMVLVYGIPCGRIWDQVPMLVPYFAERNPKQNSKIKYVNFHKSFLFEGGGCYQNISTACHAVNSISREMLTLLDLDDKAIASHRHYTIPTKVFTWGTTGEEGITDDDRSSLIKKQIILKLWAKAMPMLTGMDVLMFRTKHSNPHLVRPSNEVVPIYSFANWPAELCFVLSVREDHFLYRLDVRVGDEILSKPVSLANHWLLLREKEKSVLYRVSSVQDAEILRFMAGYEFKMTVLPKDMEKFRLDFLGPLIDHYPIVVEHDGRVAYFLERGMLCLLRKRILVVVQGELLIVRPTCVYEHAVVTNPLYNGNTVLLPNGGKVEVFRRNKKIEHEFRDLLAELHPEFSEQADTGYFSLPVSQVITGTWLVQTVETLHDNQVEILGLDDLQGFHFSPHPVVWDIDISGDKDWFDIGMDVSFGKQRFSLAELEKCIRRGNELVELPDGSVGLLPKIMQQKIKPMLMLGKAGERNIRLSAKHFTAVWPFVNQISNSEILERSRRQRFKLQSLDKIQPLPKPETVGAVLRPYQEMGFSWMGFLREFGWGGILADDMGLGKTLQVLTLLDYHYRQSPEAPASLIVVPNSLLFNWQQEIQKFVPHRPVIVHHGTNRDAQLDGEAGQLVLTTYGTLIGDVEVLRANHFSYLVLDESQAIKNPLSKRFECAQAVPAEYRLALTGTPIENGIADLFAQLDFVNPGFLGTYGQFKKNFPGIADNTASKETKESLQRIIAPFLLRRTKAQVAKDLPEKTEMVLYCDMLPEQRKIYERYRKYFRGELEGKVGEGMDKAKFFVLEGLMKLRQVCNSPSLIKSENLPNLSAKLDEMKEHVLEKTQGHKLLIFSSFTAMLGLMKAELEAFGISYAYLDGKVPGDQRQAAVAKFQNDEACRVFLISLKAGGTGLNLTAADYVYILDPWWNPAAEAQAIDRCYRIGQDKHVMAYRMICKDSIEEKILDMQASKRALADTLIQTDNSVLKALNKDELLRLFD